MAFSESENRKSSGENLEEDKVFHQTAKSNEMKQVTTETMSSFMEATTLHGARFLFSGGYFRRLIWAVALGFCFGYCIYQIFKAVDAFYGKPFNTRITQKGGNIMNENLTFPAVSLCNFNSFNRRRYINFMKTRNMSSNDEIKLNLKFIESLLAKSNNVFNSSSKKDHFYLFDRTICEDGSDTCYLTLFSHQIDEMLLPSPTFESCDINGIPCGSSNFSSFINSVFGQCYTFNSGHYGFPLINATMAGHLNGLKLLLHVERDSYLDTPTNPYVGLTVLVHDQQTFPFMEQFGFAVQPGVRTLCAIRRKKVINLPSPYLANCTTRNLDILRKTNYTYSKPACLMHCLSHFVIETCGCRPIEYKDPTFPLCASNDTVFCLLPAYESFGKSKEKEECEKNCQEPCHHTDYEISLSYAGLQRNVFIKKLNAALNDTENFPGFENFLNISYSEKKQYIDDNIVSLDIFFQELSYDEIRQTPQFTDWSLVATLGGNFGLFLGMSILTLLEFVDFALRTFCVFIWNES